jgi:hypothetical protein
LLKARIGGEVVATPFHDRDLCTLAVIGRSRALADFGWLRLTGFAAWLTLSLAHLMLLVDFRSRPMVYVNWSWTWFTRLVIRARRVPPRACALLPRSQPLNAMRKVATIPADANAKQPRRIAIKTANLAPECM